MKTFRAFTFVFLAAIAHAVLAQLPDVITRSHHGIKWLYEEAENGRFMYDLSRDYPNFEQSWPEFLANHGKAIVDEH